MKRNFVLVAEPVQEVARETLRYDCSACQIEALHSIGWVFPGVAVALTNGISV